MPKRRPRFFDKTKQPSRNLVARKFGKLTVVEWAGRSDIGNSPYKSDFWICECECKDPNYSPLPVQAASLISGNTTSCGCIHRKHMMSRHPLYTTWNNMIRRCYDPANRAYHNYGGRGITVCDRWRENFANFYADMGDPPSNEHTLDRINNDLGYSPENCRWATRKQQTRNTRRNRKITWQGETKSIADWAEDQRLLNLCLCAQVLNDRIRLGWSVEEAFTTPLVNGKVVTFQGETLSMMDWSRRLGATANVVSKRLRDGWSVSEAITTPLGKCRKKSIYATKNEYKNSWRRRRRAQSKAIHPKPTERWLTLSDEELEKLVWTKSIQLLSEEMGVSDSLIRKRCKHRGIKTPPVGFWAKVKAGKAPHPGSIR